MKVPILKSDVKDEWFDISKDVYQGKLIVEDNLADEDNIKASPTKWL